MITKFNQNPKNTVWMHENNIAHGSGNTLKRDLRTGYKYLSLNNIEEREPLKVKKMTNLTFKGFHLVSSRKILNILAEQFAPGQKISPKNAYKKIIEILPDINKDYEYLRLALEKSGDKITGDLVISEPVYSRFAKAVVAPAKALVSALKYPFLSKQAKEGLKNQKEIQQAASSLVGIYKKVTSMEGKSSNEIKKAISGFVNKQLNSLKTNYSINIASPIITLVAGGLSAWFLANDFSNMKRLATDDPVEAKKEWKSKFKQVTLGIGLASYLTYVTNTTFKKTVNSSLKFAVGLNAVNLAITEIISRKLTGRPVFLQRNPKSNETNSTINKYSGLLNNNGKSAFSAFITDKSPSSVTFTGSLLQKAITSTIPREKFVESMNLLKQVDRKRYIQVINTVKSEFLKSGIFKDQKVSLLKMLKDKNYLNNIAEIPIGKNNFYNSMVDLGKALTFPIKPIIILAKKALGKSNPSEKESLGPLFVKNTLEILNKAKQGVGNTLESIKTNYGSAIAKQLSSEKPTYGGE
ncbi:MAG TPA: hypothetical protein DDX14_03155, partial [Cyanobacteria bacterium UBA9579]|nr:hypothetical protein [Cyanobacteria bacterium UBA9579]